MSRGASRLVVGLAAVLLTLVGVRWLAAEPFQVASASMAPTLSPGEHVLVNKLAYRSGAPAHGDLVVLRRPATGEIMLKRVVAVGGDSVGLEDGVLTVNGRAHEEPFVDHQTIDSIYFGPVRVPHGQVFVMGDQRANSMDSRDFGPVPRERVIGRVDLRIWPLGRVGDV